MTQCQWDTDIIKRLLVLYKERCATIKELVDTLVTLHEKPNFSSNDGTCLIQESEKQLLTKIVPKLESILDFTVESVQLCVKTFCMEQGIKLPLIAQPLRIALTGGTNSPGIFELIVCLGKKETIARIQKLQQASM
jgi:glutamyl-tRNA synthetase